MDGELEALLSDLKTIVPKPDHAALESRLQTLLNDPDVDNGDISRILRAEFGAETL